MCCRPVSKTFHRKIVKSQRAECRLGAGTIAPAPSRLRRRSRYGFPIVGAEPGSVYRRSRNIMFMFALLGCPGATYHGSRLT